MWSLGEHRIVCGDCTDKAVVERVMGGEVADFSITDPPYNVGKTYTAKTNDSMSREEYTEWCKKWIEFMPLAIGLTVGIKRLMWWGDILGDPDWTISWVKMNGAAQSGIAGPNKWDPVLLFNSIHDKGSDVIEINNNYHQGGEHPTAKPVRLWERLITRFFQGHIVYEPFSGSGTTLIACENLGRKCRAIEIDPGYVAVTLQRWADHTNQQPELIK